jgi:hypothetical protein
MEMGEIEMDRKTCQKITVVINKLSFSWINLITNYSRFRVGSGCFPDRLRVDSRWVPSRLLVDSGSAPGELRVVSGSVPGGF